MQSEFWQNWRVESLYHAKIYFVTTCSYLTNCFKLHNNLYARSYILHKYEKGGHQKNYLFGVPTVLIALLVHSKISLQDLRFLKRCLWRCWSSGMSRPVAWRQWPACCRRAVPSSISSSCLGSLSQQVRYRLHTDIASYPRRTERFGLRVLLWPVPHVHTSTSSVHYFGPTHFLKIILILSCRLPSDLLPSCCLTNLLRFFLSKTRICFGC
jgi:hypothetical protein